MAIVVSDAGASESSMLSFANILQVVDDASWAKLAQHFSSS